MNSICMQKVTRSCEKSLSNRIRNVQFSYKQASLFHLLKRVDFDAIVDHLALMHIVKSKAEPAMTRIKRLLEL